MRKRKSNSRKLLLFIVFSFAVYALVAQGGRAGDIFQSDRFPEVRPVTDESSGSVGDYSQLKQADESLSRGDPATAEKLAGKTGGGLLALWRNIIEAEVLNARNLHDKALARLKTNLQRPEPEFSFGETFYRSLYRRHHTARATALSALDQEHAFDDGEIYVLDAADGADGDTPALTPEQKISLLHNLHFSYKYKRIPGVVTAGEILSAHLDEGEKCRALFELGNGLRYNPGMAADSMDAFSTLVGRSCPDVETSRALYWLGYQAVKQGDLRVAEPVLTRLYKSFPRSRLADDALYHLYRGFEKSGDARKAQNYKTKLLERSQGDMRHDSLFEEAFPKYLQGEFAKAADILKPAETGEPSADESLPRALYWRARALQKADPKTGDKTAKRIYADIAKYFPFSFYAVMAANRLGAAVKIPPLKALKGSGPSGAGAFSLIDALNKRGAHADASAVMDLAVHAHPEWEETHTEFIARKFMESGNYRKALEMASKHFDSGVYGPIEVKQDAMFSAFYPRAFARETAKAYALTGLPKGAIEGIMREESLFQPNVRSWAGAVGLMQIMPSTGQMLKRQISAPLGELTDPQTSAILGATYLKDMRTSLGSLPLAVMAYNAGPGNVRKWLRNVDADEMDEFIERIPITETRGYVKRVVRSMQVYGALYGDANFRKPFFGMKMR